MCYAFPMEIFIFICLAVVAGCVFFWLFAFPGAVLVGAVCSIVKGVREGLKRV